MTNIIKLSIFAGVIAIAFGVFAFTPAVSQYTKDTIMSPITAFAYVSGEGGTGCGGCGGSAPDFGGDGPDHPCDTNPGSCEPVQTPASCDFLDASKTTLPYGGGDVTLSWGTTNATSVSLSGVGTVSADGSKTVHVTGDKTFVLTATGTGGNDTCTKSIKVEEQSVASCDFLTVSPSHLSESGNVTLTWETTNATSVSINNGVGSVSADGSTVVYVSDDKTFVLTATGTDGNDTCQASVTVDEVEEETPRCDFFHISDSSVEEGDEVTLSWGTTNADSVYINNGVGYVSDDGDKDIRVYDDEDWTLTVKNGSKEDTCHVSVNVDEDEDNDPRPKCELDISDDEVNRGDEVTLEWDTTYADDIQIKDDNGKTIFDTDDYSSSKRKKYYDGEIDIVINRDTEFTLIARGDGGKRECDVDVEVKDDVTVFEKRDQPYVISLTQVPYTGFEAGPTLTFIFYALITLWALFVSYILVIKKGSILGFSLYGAHGATVREDEEYKKKVEKLVAKYAHRPWN